MFLDLVDITVTGVNTFLWLGIYRESSVGEKFREFHESGSIRKCFLVLSILAGIFIYEIAWIAKVFSRTTAKKAIRETFLPRMIPVIRYLSYTPWYILDQ